MDKELTTEDHCEALVRHVEMTGSDVLEKNFVQDGIVLASVWCIVGEDAGKLAKAIRKWLANRDFLEDY